MRSLSALLAVVVALSSAASLWAQTPAIDALRALANQGDRDAQYVFGCMHDVGCLEAKRLGEVIAKRQRENFPNKFLAHGPPVGIPVHLARLEVLETVVDHLDPFRNRLATADHAVGDALVRKGLINSDAAQNVSSNEIELFDVRKSTLDPEAQSLSGGNLQKFVVGREMALRPKVLVVNQPTWGVDAGAAALIRQALIDLARSGSAVLVISQDLDEIFEVADRIAVISRGELSEAYLSEEINLEQIGLLMAGAHENSANAGAS